MGGPQSHAGVHGQPQEGLPRHAQVETTTRSRQKWRTQAGQPNHTTSIFVSIFGVLANIGSPELTTVDG